VGWSDELTKMEENVRREAEVYAKQRVDELQTVSNPNEQSKLILDRSTASKIVKAILIPYGTFNSNARMRLMTSWKYMVLGNAAQKKAAAADMIATFAEGRAFFAMSETVVKGLILKSLVEAMAAAVGGDEEDDEREKASAAELANTKFWTSMISDNIAVVFGSPLETVLLENAALLISPESTKPMRRTYLESALDMTGPYGGIGRTIKKGLENTEIYREAASPDDDPSRYEKDGLTYKEGEPLTESDKDLALFVLALQAGAVAGYVPADVSFALQRKLNSRVRQRRKAYQYYQAPE